MAQKPLLWVEVGAHSVRNRSKCGGVGLGKLPMAIMDYGFQIPQAC